MISVQIPTTTFTNIARLEKKIITMPNKIASINDKATMRAGGYVLYNIRKRGKPGRFIEVYVEKYGKAGARLKIKAEMSRGGFRSAGGFKRAFNGKIAASIFMKAESGKIGRRAFTIKKRLPQRGETTSRYMISHTSGRWKKGQKLHGPLRIPQLNPFHFSAKSGMPRITIQAKAKKILIEELTKSYSRIKLV
jgi:hypothetical protein